MNAKTLIALIVLCAGLAYFGIQSPQQKKGNALGNTEPFKHLDLNAIDSIEIQKGNEELKLLKVDDQWRAQNKELDYPVDFSKLRTKLLDLQKTTLLSKVASNREVDDRFGLDETSEPTVLNFKAGDKTLAKLELGKGRESKNQGASPFGGFPREQGQFLRYGKDASVYMAKDRLSIDTSSYTWLNRTIAKAQKDEISQVELIYPDKNIVLSKTSQTIEKSTDGSVPPETITTWSANGSSLELQVEQTSISSWLDDLDSIDISEPVPSHKRSQFTAEHQYQLKVKRGDAALYELGFSKVDNDWYAWKLDQDKEIYKISSFNVEKILSHNDTLFSLQDFSISGNVSSLSWGDHQFLKEGDQWQLKGLDPKPEVKQETLNTLSETLKKIEALDLYPSTSEWLKKRKPKKTLTLKADQNNSIESLGEGPFESAQLLNLNGQFLSVPSVTFDKLFPESSDVINIPKAVESLDELSTLAWGDLALEKKEETWAFSDGTELKKGALDSWIDSLNMIYESQYLPQETLSAKNMSIKLGLQGGLQLHIDIGPSQDGYTKVKTSQWGGIFKVKSEILKSLNKTKEQLLKS